jgi:hypothetical protein
VNLNERFNRLDTFITEDRLVRKAWGDGQERACLLLALAPEVGAKGAVERCPAYLIPSWLAYLTPDLDDCGTEAAWPAMVRRYSVVVRRGATTLDDAGWRRVLARTMLAVLAEVTPHDLSGSCARVAALWTRVLAGDEPREEEWEEWVVGAARTAEAAAAVGQGAGGVAEAAARAAAWARSAARGAGGAAGAAAAVAREAAAWEVAWDRITTALLDGIEIECGVSREETK